MLEKWRTNRRLKKSSRARYCDKYLRRLMIQYNQHYLDFEDHKLLLEAIDETESDKDANSRLTELLCFYGLIVRNGEESEYRDKNIANAVFGLKKYHAIVLLDALIELVKKPRAKKLYRFHGSRNVFEHELRRYRENERLRKQPIQIVV